MPAKAKLVKPWEAPAYKVTSLWDLGGGTGHADAAKPEPPPSAPPAAKPHLGDIGSASPCTWETTRPKDLRPSGPVSFAELGPVEGAPKQDPTYRYPGVGTIGPEAAPVKPKAEPNPSMDNVGNTAGVEPKKTLSKKPHPASAAATGTVATVGAVATVDTLGGDRPGALLLAKGKPPEREPTKADRRDQAIRDAEKAARAERLQATSRYKEDFMGARHVPSKFDKPVPRPKTPPRPKYKFEAESAYQAGFKGTRQIAQARSCKPQPAAQERVRFDAVTTAEHDYASPPQGAKGLTKVRLGASGKHGVAWVGDPNRKSEGAPRKMTSYGAETGYSATYRGVPAVMPTRVVPREAGVAPEAAQAPFTATSRHQDEYPPRETQPRSHTRQALHEASQLAGVLYGGEDHSDRHPRQHPSSAYVAELRAKTAAAAEEEAAAPPSPAPASQPSPAASPLYTFATSYQANYTGAPGGPPDMCLPAPAEDHPVQAFAGDTTYQYAFHEKPIDTAPRATAATRSPPREPPHPFEAASVYTHEYPRKAATRRAAVRPTVAGGAGGLRRPQQVERSTWLW